ncbi:D-aminoacylase [Halomonas denitrificans]|uniref:N-acyl-D-amino-acid deacylase family protein n=1 Tax=Halomonas denitrificans TaxID=370769 RepID=UPI001CD4AF80|nr:D-aminoacylase [Halomonas denitrificans]MCA0976539.1 D-aminoacylase [Halomonas denitrificans]
MFDTILMGGMIYDGSGEKPYQADIGIVGNTIAEIGDLSHKDATNRIDVKGLVVCPGFIDIHTHSDMVLLADGKADSQVMQGVTTELAGQCGFSAAPVGDSERMEKWMIGRLPGVNVSWRSFGGYLDVLEEKHLGLNVMAMVGHGAIRGAVLGDEIRQPTEDELKKMEALVAESLEEGAWGMSTGLEYWPGIGASTDELTRLCKVVAQRGGFHASHVRNRDVHYDIGFTEVISVGRASGVRTQISHIQPKWGRPDHAMNHALDMIDQAKSVGVDVGFDIIPHVWSHTGVAAILPSWAREGGVEHMIERLKNPALRERIKANPTPMWRLILDERWDLIYFLRGMDGSIIGRTVAEVAEERGTAPYDTVLDLLVEAGSDALSMLWTSKSFFEEDLEKCVKRSDCAIMSDTLAISRQGPTGELIGSLAGYGWVARFLEHYVHHLKLIPLEEGIRRMTGLPAQRIGISDRGTLRVGAKADITVFDFDKVAYRCTVDSPREHPTGFVHVFVNGKQAVADGVRTPVDAGCVLRRAG